MDTPETNTSKNTSQNTSPTLSATSDASSSYYEFDDFSLDFENDVLGSFGFIFQDFNQKLKSKRDQFKRVFDSKTRDGRKRLKRKLRNANTVLLRDKIAFLIGASNLWIIPLLICLFPSFIPVYYAVTTVCLITLRFFLYKSKHMHYFTADLCYMVNLILFVFLFFGSNSRFLFISSFCLSNGPVMWAIWLWRNSFVFHSIDKITSVV